MLLNLLESQSYHPSSMSSSTYQWTNARLVYIRSNFLSNRAHASIQNIVHLWRLLIICSILLLTIAVVLYKMQNVRYTLSRSPSRIVYESYSSLVGVGSFRLIICLCRFCSSYEESLKLNKNRFKYHLHKVISHPYSKWWSILHHCCIIRRS